MLRFEVAPETFALFREAMSELRRRSDARLDDDALLLTLARGVLEGPRDEGRSSYQVSLMVCSKCGAGAQVGAGEIVPVGPEVVEMAQCDCQALRQAATPANDAHAHGGVRDLPAPARARQPIPPAVRRTVVVRDQRRCRVSGCRNATFVDVHHIQLRSEGGRNQADNLVTLCGAHHRALHRGELVIEDSTAAGIRFRHADGSRYGEAPNIQAIEAYGKVHSALRQLGFREADVRAALTELREQGTTDPAADSLLRAALQWLTPARSARRAP